METRSAWNKTALHPLQAEEWGEFRKATGVRVVREGGLQMTIHQIPGTGWTIGYAPKGTMPDKKQVKMLREIARQYNCIFIKLEPKVEVGDNNRSAELDKLRELGLVKGRPLFTKYNFVLDVRPSEEEIRAGFKQKTRYNIKLAEKRGVRVELDDSPAAFAKYLELTEETTKRQGFFAHSRQYHERMWEKLHPAGIAHLLTAKYNGEIITTWILFKFNDTLYYPYGASTREHREVMANNLVMWEAIKLAKKWKLKYLDMWGALGPDADPKDPWFGFHTFKAGYGARHVEYVGTWDYVARPILYRLYRAAEIIRWKLLKAR